jgi:hypothetical protein
MVRRLLIVVVMAGLLLGVTGQARAQQGIVVSDVGVHYDFGLQITFAARIQAASPIQQIVLMFRDQREANTHTFPVQANADGWIAYQYNASENTLRPFAPVVFWFVVTLQDGQVLASAPYQFRYDDNRFAWQKLQDGDAQVFWYNGDAVFGQAALDVTRLGLSNLKDWLSMPQSGGVEVYVYASVDDLRNALYLGGQSWTGAHASPELGVVMVAVAPGAEQRSTMEQVIPHELTHVLLYRKVGTGYSNLPAWMNEGIATMAELYANPDYDYVLKQASRDHTLIPLSSLCDTFPADASGAFQAYAESASFVRYLRDTYGSSGMAALVQAYADGQSCEQAPRQAMDTSLTRLESDWREQVLGENPAGTALRNLLPFYVMMGLILLIPGWGVLLWWRGKGKSNG